MKTKTKSSAPIWLIVSALSALLGCSSEVSEPVPPASTEWQQIDSKCDFFFDAPPDMQRQAVTGIDSCVGELKGAGMSLSYDYGGYSDPLDSYSENVDYKEESATINGFQAKIISFRFMGDQELPYVIAAHFPDIGVEFTKLTMWITCAGPAEVEKGRQIIDSISFP